jgi:hypothetical protein
MDVQAQAKPNFAVRFVQYFVDRRRGVGIFGAILLAMYVAHRRGYLKKLFEYMLTKVQERISKQMEEANKEMLKQQARSEEFSNALKNFSEKFPNLAMNHLTRQIDVIYNLESIKESLKNKGLDQAEKTKRWQSFRESICRSLLYVIISRSYLWSVWLIRDMLQAKLKSALDELISTASQKDTKFLSDSIGSTQDFINNFVEGVVSHTLQSFIEPISKLSSTLEFKLTDKVSIDDMITKLEVVKTSLLSQEATFETEKPDQFEISIRRLGVAKNFLKFNLVHQRARKSSFSLRNSIKGIFNSLFQPSPSRLNVEFNQTVFSKKAFWGFKNYFVDLHGYSLVGYFLSETRRKSNELLSPIVELDEVEEDQSGDLEVDARNKLVKELIYEESSTIEGKNYESQQFIISSLERIVHNSIKEFLDDLTSANCQLLTEVALEYNFKKFATRLHLFKMISKENQGEMVYLKMLTSISKIIEEEMVNKVAFKNDTSLYEARTKELFKLAKKSEVENVEQTIVNIEVAEEAKAHAIIQRSTREWAARIFFEEEFDMYYGDEFQVGEKEGESPAKQEQRELMEMLSRLKPPEQGQAEPGMVPPFLQVPSLTLN